MRGPLGQEVVGAAAWHAGRVLSGMRGRDGGPNWAIRGLALVVALLLAGPLTVYVFRAVAGLLSYAL